MTRSRQTYLGLNTFAVIQLLSLAAHAEKSEVKLITEFEQTCLAHGRDAEALSSSFEEGGWDDLTQNPTPKLSELLRIGEEAAKSLPGGAGIDEVLVFEIKVGQRQFEAFVSLNHYESQKSVGCQIYDFAADESEFPTTYPSQLNGAEPVKQEQSDFKFLTWKKPAQLPGFINAKIGYFAPHSKPAELSGISGIFMSTTAQAEE